MTIAVRDIASFENSQALMSHYSDIKKRLRPQRRVNLLAAPKAASQNIAIRHPRRRQRNGLTGEQIYQNCQTWFNAFAIRQGVKVELFSTRALPLEGFFIQAEFFQHCVYQLGADFKQLANLTGFSVAIVKSICTEYDNFYFRSKCNDCDVSVAHNKNENDPLMCIAVELALKYRATIEDIQGKSQANYKLMARQEFMYRATHETKKNAMSICEFIHKDHKSITLGLASHKARMDAYQDLLIGSKS